MPDVLELHEFFVEGGAEKKSHVLLHISEPSTPEEKKKGYFFAVAEIQHGTLQQIKQLQDMIDDTETAYFETKQPTANDEFEFVIGELNRRGHRLLDHPEANVHCFIGVLQGNNIQFVFHGAPQGTVLYRRDDDIEHIDLVGKPTDDHSRLFSSIVSGAIGSGDYFYVATPKVREFFDEDRIKKLLMGRTTRQITEHMEKVLASLRDGSSYGGLLFHIAPRHEIPKTGPQPKYVEPQPPNRPHIQRSAPPRGNLLVGIGKAFIAGGILLVRFIKHIGILCGKGIITGIILVTNKGGQRALVLEEIQAWGAQKKQQFKELSLVSKILFCIALSSAGIFVGSMGYFAYKEKQEERLLAYTQIVQAIRDKKNAAEASSIYGDDTKAFTLLKEAEALLTSLPKENNNEKRGATTLQSDIEALLQKLRKWDMVTAQPIIDLRTAGGTPAANDLAMIDGNILAYGPEDTRLYIANPNTKTLEAKPHESISLLRSGNTPKEEDTTIFATGQKYAAAYDKNSKKIVTKDISFPADTVTIQSLFVYNQRLFTLDRATNQIYRHAKTQTGYDRGAPWIKDMGTVDIRTAVSLAIDGDIYVLTHTDVFLFSGGNSKAFTVQNLDPALDQPVKIWTYNGVPYLYILEPTHKRLIVLDKTGVLVRQYTDKAWKNPTGMVINTEENSAYILDSNIIYHVSLK